MGGVFSAAILTPCFGTTIVILILHDRVILAADSKSVGIYTGTGEKKVFTTTKIGQAGIYLFATAGFSGNYSGSGFNPNKTIGTFLKKYPSLNATNLKLLKDELTKGCMGTVNSWKSTPRLMEKLRKIHNMLIQSSIVWVDQHGPHCLTLQYRYNSAQDRMELIEEQDENIEKNKSLTLYLGQTDAIEEYIKKYGQGEFAYDYVQKLMDVAIKDVPSEVGYPIDMVDYSTAGLNWITKQQNTPVVY